MRTNPSFNFWSRVAMAPEDGSGAGAGVGGDSAPASGGGAADSGGSASPADSGSGIDSGVVDRTNDFEQLGAFDDDDVVEVTELAPPADAPKVPPTEPQLASAQTPKPPAPPVAPPAAQQQPAPAAVQQPAQAATPAAAASPRGLAEQLDQHRDAILDQLATTRFAVTQEEADALFAEPTKMLPKAMARVYYQAQQSALLAMEQHVPRMVMQLLDQVKSHDELENAFYGQHKALNKQKHHADVVSFAKVLRQTNPQMSQNDLLAMTAAAVMAKHGLQVPVANGGNGAVQHQQPGVQQPPPFVPARPGVGGVRVSTSADPNPYAGLGQEWDDEG
jgi:hypothetical protein